jgi:hypothetical protein
MLVRELFQAENQVFRTPVPKQHFFLEPAGKGGARKPRSASNRIQIAIIVQVPNTHASGEVGQPLSRIHTGSLAIIEPNLSWLIPGRNMGWSGLREKSIQVSVAVKVSESDFVDPLHWVAPALVERPDAIVQQDLCFSARRYARETSTSQECVEVAIPVQVSQLDFIMTFLAPAHLPRTSLEVSKCRCSRCPTASRLRFVTKRSFL